MKRTTNSKHINKAFELILVSMLSATLCACSFGTSGEPAQPSDPEVVETDNNENEIENQEDPSSNGNSEEPEIVEEEPHTVVILGTEYDINAEMLDLSGMTSNDVTAVAEAISGMPELKTVNLVPAEEVVAVEEVAENSAEVEEVAEDSAEVEEVAENSAEIEDQAAVEDAVDTEEVAEVDDSLHLSDVALLKEAAPNVHFIYEFDLFGSYISTSATEVKYVNTQIGNEGEESIRQALTILDECTYFLLDDCGIDDEIMAQIREDYPDTKVVWRVHVGPKSALTDDPIIRMTHGINDSMTGPLKYCNEVVYMDLGHDSGITDISFLEYMPLLECLILSDAQFKDLTPVTYCTNMTWLELISCYSMQNLSVISEMESIKYLNISNTGTTDITGIMNMNLDRFCCIGNRVPAEDFEQFKELHPDCMSVSSGNPYGYAWRYDDYGYHFFSYYARMREVFRYETWSPGGFKWPEDEVAEEEVTE